MPDGTVQAETVGIKGKKCLKYIPVLEDMMEARSVEEQLSEEYYQREEQEKTYNKGVVEVES